MERDETPIQILKVRGNRKPGKETSGEGEQERWFGEKGHQVSSKMEIGR